MTECFFGLVGVETRAISKLFIGPLPALVTHERLSPVAERREKVGAQTLGSSMRGKGADIVESKQHNRGSKKDGWRGTTEF